MSDVRWLSITTYCSGFGIVFSLLTNCTVLLLLTRRQVTSLGSYRYLMITFSLCSMFYSLIEIFLRPLMHVYDDTTFIIQRKRFDYPRGMARALSCSLTVSASRIFGLSATYCGCFASTFTLFAVHFVYRYFAVCDSKKLEYFNGIRFLWWIFGIICIAVSWAVFAFFCFPETDRTLMSFKNLTPIAYGLDPQFAKYDYVPYTFWYYENGTAIVNSISMIGVAQHMLVMLISFGTVFGCGYLTAVGMKLDRVLSGKTKSLQRQLFRALVAQTAAPLIFMYLPTTMIFLAPFVGVNIGAYGNVTIVSAHLYPGIDPLLVILLITDFRRALSKVFCDALKFPALLAKAATSREVQE